MRRDPEEIKEPLFLWFFLYLEIHPTPLSKMVKVLLSQLITRYWNKQNHFSYDKVMFAFLFTFTGCEPR